MKAWMIEAENVDYVEVIHADTRSEAKTKSDLRSDNELEWIEVKAKRYPALDDKPTSLQNLLDSGIIFMEMETEDEFLSTCLCPTCKEFFKTHKPTLYKCYECGEWFDESTMVPCKTDTQGRFPESKMCQDCSRKDKENESVA